MEGAAAWRNKHLAKYFGNFRMSHPGPCWGSSAPAAAREVAFSPTESQGMTEVGEGLQDH